MNESGVEVGRAGVVVMDDVRWRGRKERMV